MENGEDREYYTDGSMAFLKSAGGDEDNSTALSTLGKCKDANGTKINNTEAFKASFLQKNTYYLSTISFHIKNLSVSPPKKSITRLLSVYGKRTERR